MSRAEREKSQNCLRNYYFRRTRFLLAEREGESLESKNADASLLA